MAFDWMDVPHPARPDAAADQLRRAIKEQAALLRRLGYKRAYAVARARGNVDWSFECSGKSPLTKKEIDKLVASVYA